MRRKRCFARVSTRLSRRRNYQQKGWRCYTKPSAKCWSLRWRTSAAASIWKKDSRTAQLSKDSGRSTNAKASPVSGAARALSERRMAGDRLTGARGARRGRVQITQKERWDEGDRWDVQDLSPPSSHLSHLSHSSHLSHATLRINPLTDSPE